MIDSQGADSGSCIGVVACAVERIMGQAAAWNDGDIERALEYYCPSPDLTWVSKAGVSFGFAPFAADMRRSFTPETMGVMQSEVLHAVGVGEGAALVSLRWSVTRDGARLMGGISTQLWAPCKGALRVTLEHAS